MSALLPWLERLLDGAPVAWIPLGDIADIQKGSTITRKQIKDGNIPVIAGGKEPAYFHNVANRNAHVITVSASGSAGFVNYFTHPIFASDCNTIISKDKESFSTKFIYEFLKSKQDEIYKLKKGTSQPHVYAKDLAEIEIPIPCPDNPAKSLAIQGEIVRILDKFSELVSELVSELNKEYNLRKKQYKFYRDKLLTFSPDSGIVWKSLGEFAQYSKTRIDASQLDNTNYVGVDNLLQNRIGKTESNYVPHSGKLIKYRKGDILIGNIRPYLKKIWHADGTGGTNGDVLVISTIDKAINSRYLYQNLADDRFFEYNMRHAKGGKMPRGDKSKILNYKIPVPSLVEQTRIVAMLDKFETLTNSISEGLPREIELRQKQYEYYRNQLLNFPKL